MVKHRPKSSSSMMPRDQESFSDGFFRSQKLHPMHFWTKHSEEVPGALNSQFLIQPVDSTVLNGVEPRYAPKKYN